MKFTTSATALLALVSSAFAQTENFDAISSPAKGQSLTAGQTYPITWDPTASYDGQTVTIRLLQGADQNSLDFGPNVVSSIDSALGTYSWTVDSALVGYATYGLKLQLDSEETTFQYSFPFHIVGGSDSSGSTLSSSPTSSSASAASSSSASTGSSPLSVATTTDTSPSSSAASGTLVPTDGSGNTASATASSPTGGQTTLTTATKPSSTGSGTTSSTSTYQTAGAGKVVAGSFAAVGGVVAAVLAL